MKLEEFLFITDFTILFQSGLFTRAAEGQEIQADLRSYQVTPPPPTAAAAALPPSAALRPMWLESGSHGKPFSNLTRVYDASLAAR